MNDTKAFDTAFVQANSASPEQFATIITELNLQDDDAAADALLSQCDVAAFQLLTHFCISGIQNLLLKNLEEDEFYECLRSFIYNNPVLATADEQRLAFLIAAMNDQLPYKHIEVISMDNEEYASRKETLNESILNIFQLANRPFSQKTENASALLDVIENYPDKVDRTILLAAIIDAFQLQADK